MKTVSVRSVSKKVAVVKRLLETAGTNIGSVSFIKRSDNSPRRIAYRIHCRKPTFAPIPSGKDPARRERNRKQNLITLLDVNQPLYNSKGHIIGRGQWKSIPLDSVVRIKSAGVIYRFK